jgi:hypothetical protein
MEDLRILFLAASPADQDRLQVEAEFKQIEGELDRSPYHNRFDFRFVPAVRRGDLLRQLIKLKPQIVHFSGHGTDQDELILENEYGISESLGVDELEQLFTIIPEPHRPRVVVLSACYSERQALAVTKAVDCAIGMASAIRDSAAFAFAQGFYLALAQGLAVEPAVQAGRLAMPSGQGTLPRLHVRNGASLANLQLIGQGPVSRFPADLQINRAEQLECFTSMLERGDPRVLVVTADGNMGKTRLMQKMAQSAVHHMVAAVDLTRGAPTPEMVANRLASGIGVPPRQALSPIQPGSDRVHSPEVAATQHAALISLTDELLTAANRLGLERGTRVAFLLDGFDDPQGEVAAWIEMMLLPGLIQRDNLVCVLAGRARPQVVTGFHLKQEYQLAHFAVPDLREVMSLLRLDSSDSVVRTFWIATDKGHPYVTMSKLEELWRDAISGARDG